MALGLKVSFFDLHVSWTLKTFVRVHFIFCSSAFHILPIFLLAYASPSPLKEHFMCVLGIMTHCLEGVSISFYFMPFRSCFWQLLLHKHLKFLCDQAHQSFGLRSLYFYVWKCFPHLETAFDLEQHIKRCFKTLAIFSGSLWKGICGKWARWEQRGARAQWGAGEWMLMRCSLLIMLPRLFPFLLTTSSEDWWEEGRRDQCALNHCPLGGLGGSWHLSQICPLASFWSAIPPREPAGPSACLLLIWLEMGVRKPGERKGKRCTEHRVPSWAVWLVRGKPFFQIHHLSPPAHLSPFPEWGIKTQAQMFNSQ